MARQSPPAATPRAGVCGRPIAADGSVPPAPGRAPGGGGAAHMRSLELASLCDWPLLRRRRPEGRRAREFRRPRRHSPSRGGGVARRRLCWSLTRVSPTPRAEHEHAGLRGERRLREASPLPARSTSQGRIPGTGAIANAPRGHVRSPGGGCPVDTCTGMPRTVRWPSPRPRSPRWLLASRSGTRGGIG